MVNLMNETLKFGLLSALINAVFIISSYYGGILVGNESYLIYSSTILTLLVGVIMKSYYNQSTSFKQIFKDGMKTASVFSIASILFLILFFKVIAPDYFGNMISEKMELLSYSDYVNSIEEKSDLLSEDEFFKQNRETFESVYSLKLVIPMTLFFLIFMSIFYSFFVSVFYTKILNKR